MADTQQHALGRRPPRRIGQPRRHPLAARRPAGGGPRPVPWLIAVPSVVMVLAFHFVAPLAAFWYAFTDWDGVGTPHWVGLENFRNVFQSDGAGNPLVNTLV